MDFLHGITIIGNGNVAWYMGYMFDKLKIPVNAFVGRNPEKIQDIAKTFHSKGIIDYSEIPSETSLILICVSDDAIHEVAEKLVDFEAPVAHTAGSIPLSIFSDNKKMRGVLYPFQTFTKNLLTGSNSTFPICIEARCQSMSDLLITLAKKITSNVVMLSSERRKKLHMSGIIVNNFSNYLYSMAYHFLESNKIEPRLLIPLIEETTKKLNLAHPADVQTGPARRGNNKVIEDHLKILSEDPSLHQIYKIFSQQIYEYYNKNNG